MSSISSEPKELNDIEWWDIPFCEIETEFKQREHSKQIEHYKAIFVKVTNFPSVLLDMALVLALTTILF